jgi:hypothetical protein
MIHYGWARQAVILTVLFIPLACLAEFTLVENGVPKATIVIEKEAVGAPVEAQLNRHTDSRPAAHKIATAAHELQLYVQKITGAVLPIVGDDKPVLGSVILVGRSALTKAFDGRIPAGMTPDRNEEGYLILAADNWLVLAGNDAPVYHGTEYAVYALLHRFGVRWYMPGEFGEIVPQRTTLRVGELNITDRPDFKWRNWWGLQAADRALMEYRWKLRNGMNPVNNFHALPSDSSIRGVLPPASEVGKPEYAKVFGLDEKGQPNPYMPNLTSLESVEYVAEKIKAYFRAHPEAGSIGISPDDGYPRDFSPDTVKRNLGFPELYGRIGIPAEMSATDEWFAWMQAVAAEVRTDFPDRVLLTTSYANRNTPPMGIVPDRKLWVLFAAIWSDTLHAYDNPKSWQTLRQGEILQQWTKMYDNVFVYNYIYYMLAACGAPIPLAHKHMHDMPLYKKWGVIGFFDEGRTARGETGIFPTWLRARMMWDADLDGWKLMDEFFGDWYGPAAKPAKAFWEELEVTFEQTPWAGHEDRILPYVYSLELVRRLERHLKGMEALATSEPLRARVHADRITFEHLRAYLAMHRAEFDADFAEAARQAQRMIDLHKEAAAISRFYFDPQPPNDEDPAFYAWGSVARRNYYRQMAEMTKDRLVAVLPERARFSLDPRDDGRFFGWYQPEFADGKWKTVLTTMPFYGQGYQDEQGFPYLGAVWYRLWVDVPASAKGKRIMLHAPAVETEAWVWVNGNIVGHREFRESYERPNPIDMEVTNALLPGQRNSVVIRVHTNTNPSALAGGLTSRVFLYSKAE